MQEKKDRTPAKDFVSGILLVILGLFILFDALHMKIYNTFLDVRQNRIMTVLTVVTAIFMPLTLIAGWYGMNFVYMPLLHKTWGYPAVIVASLTIVVAGLWYFRHKKWL